MFVYLKALWLIFPRQAELIHGQGIIEVFAWGPKFSPVWCLIHQSISICSLNKNKRIYKNCLIIMPFILKMIGDLLEQNMITLSRSVIGYATNLYEFYTNTNKHVKLIVSSILWHIHNFYWIFFCIYYASRL